MQMALRAPMCVPATLTGPSPGHKPQSRLLWGQAWADSPVGSLQRFCVGATCVHVRGMLPHRCGVCACACKHTHAGVCMLHSAGEQVFRAVNCTHMCWEYLGPRHAYACG